jgi:hypothetical protein
MMLKASGAAMLYDVLTDLRNVLTRNVLAYPVLMVSSAG